MQTRVGKNRERGGGRNFFVMGGRKNRAGAALPYAEVAGRCSLTDRNGDLHVRLYDASP